VSSEKKGKGTKREDEYLRNEEKEKRKKGDGKGRRSVFNTA